MMDWKMCLSDQISINSMNVKLSLAYLRYDESILIDQFNICTRLHVMQLRMASNRDLYS